MHLLKHIMTKEVDTISPDATAADASSKMKDLDIGAIPVCDGKRLVGLLTDRVLVTRVMAMRRDPVTARVSQAMTPEILFCFDDDSVETAAQLMSDKQIRRLPILSRNKQLVGIVSLGDLAVEVTDPQKAGETLKQVSDPGRANR